jgi:hypothetical protein
MKIAISGSAGTGKSTFSKALAAKLNLTHIAENYDPLNDARIKGDFPPRLTAIFHQKRTLENNAISFVTDRCPIDLLHTWLNQSCHKINPQLTAQFLRDCQQQTRAYDFVILTPWNSFKLIQNDATVMREMDIMEQLRHHASIVGHAHLWLPKTRIIEIPQNISDINERLDFVLTTIKKRRPELLQTALPN